MTEKEKTAPVVSVGADTEQSILKQTNNSITDFNEKGKSLDDITRCIKANRHWLTACFTPEHIFLQELRNLAKVFLWHSLLTISAQAHRFGILM